MFELSTKTIGVWVQEDCLWIADPKAINHILQKTGYLYAKSSDVRELTALVGDRGIAWAEGKCSLSLLTSKSNHPTGGVHTRHRRAMAPAFGLVEAKGLLPCFVDCATKARKIRSHLVLKADPGPTIRWQRSGAVS